MRLGQVVTPDPALVAQDPDQASLSLAPDQPAVGTVRRQRDDGRGAIERPGDVCTWSPETTTQRWRLPGPCRPVASPPRRQGQFISADAGRPAA